MTIDQADLQEIANMTDAEVEAELRTAGADPAWIGDMGRAIAYLGKVARFRWPGGYQQSELQRLLAEVRLDQKRRSEAAKPLPPCVRAEGHEVWRSTDDYEGMCRHCGIDIPQPRPAEASPVYWEGGWIREGVLAICPECKAVKEGTIGWHMEHESKCEWKPAGTWFAKRLANELKSRDSEAVPPPRTGVQWWSPAKGHVTITVAEYEHLKALDRERAKP